MKRLTITLSNEVYDGFERLTIENLEKEYVSQKEVETFIENFLKDEYQEVGF